MIIFCTDSPGIAGGFFEGCGSCLGRQRRKSLTFCVPFSTASRSLFFAPCQMLPVPSVIRTLVALSGTFAGRGNRTAARVTGATNACAAAASASADNNRPRGAWLLAHIVATRRTFGQDVLCALICACFLGSPKVFSRKYSLPLVLEVSRSTRPWRRQGRRRWRWQAPRRPCQR